MSCSTPYDRPGDDSGGQDSPAKKRRKGAARLSCAECRRLKLRCDRAVPCSSCVKRGCGAICPDGSLTTGQGNRFVLASTQELHEKIAELAVRVRELEDALRSSHSRLSVEQHALLTEELLKIKAPLQRELPSNRDPNAVTVKKEEVDPEVVDAFGSLQISVSGKSKYFGQIANSWYFLQNELRPGEDGEPDDALIDLSNVLSPEILTRASAFPISSTSHNDDVNAQSLYWYLPPSDIATALRSTYFSHAAWMYNPISVDAFDTQVFTPLYAQGPTTITDEPIHSHRLSLMFMVLAIGSLMNTSIPAYNRDAEKYHQLARAALFNTTIFDEPTINAVQALYLMVFYLFLADRHGTSSGARWAIMGIAVKVGQSIGLHRDSGRWKVDPQETQQRRELFWELFTYDSWQCLTFGRPPSFALPHIDCKMPFLNDTSEENSFHAWKHRFTSECMNSLHDQAFVAKMPRYATVLQLDRKLRAFPVPPILQIAGFGSSQPRQSAHPDTIMLTLQRHIVLAIRETNLLYLHRSFFARAISDHPKDPLGSPYGTSVIAAYRSAGSLVALMRNLHTQLPEPSERIWFLWTHMFSCAIVLGSIVTRCPSMSLAPSALVQLDSACELFSKAARGFRAVRVLDIMLHLQEKAHTSLEEFRRGLGVPSARYGSSPTGRSPADDDDELSILGGKTRLVKMESSSPHLERSPTSHNPIVPLPLSPTTQHQVHPSVVEYLHSFGQAPNGIQNHQASLMMENGSYSEQRTQSTLNQSPYSDLELSPVSMYGVSAIPTSPSFQSEPASYMQQPSMQMLGHQHQQQYQPNDLQRQQSGQSFPQYFPVFDYGHATMGNETNGVGGYVPTLEKNPAPGQQGQQRRGSGTPEATMQTTWQDFVNTLGM